MELRAYHQAAMRIVGMIPEKDDERDSAFRVIMDDMTARLDPIYFARHGGWKTMGHVPAHAREAHLAALALIYG